MGGILPILAYLESIYNMKHVRYKYYGLILAICYWLFDSIIHKLIFGEGDFEFIPSDVNELWMRSLIVFLIISFGFYIDISVRKLLEKEAEKHMVFRSTVTAVQHVMNNMLHKMQIYRSKMSKCGNVSDEEVHQFNELVKQAADNIKKLGNITDVNEEKIIDSVKPK